MEYPGSKIKKAKLHFKSSCLFLGFLLFHAGVYLFCLEPDLPLDQYLINKWDITSGLPENKIVAIVQTSDGFIWLATSKKLCRFDGLKFSVYNVFSDKREGFDRITCLTVDHRGHLWMGTENEGLYRFRNAPFKRFTVEDGLSGNYITYLLNDFKNNLWAGTGNNQISVITENKIKILGPLEQLPSNRLQTLFQDTKGALWFGFLQSGVFNYTDGRFKMVPVAGLKNYDARAFSEDDRGNLWIGTNYGLVQLQNNGKSILYNEGSGLSNQMINAITQDREKNLWVGTIDGLNRITLSSQNRISSISGSQPGVWINSIYEDFEKTLWIATDGNGLLQLRDSTIQTLSNKEGFSHEYIISLFEDRNNNIWVGSNRGLVVFEKGRLDVARIRLEYKYPVSGAICETSDGTIWFSTYGRGLCKIEKGKKIRNYMVSDGLLSNNITSLFYDNNQRLWIGTDRGLNYFEKNSLKVFKANQNFPRGSIYYIYQDLNKIIWLVFSRGVVFLKNGKQTDLPKKELLANLIIADIYEDTDNICWIATKGNGLIKIDGQQKTFFSTNNGLQSNIIHKIFEDKNGYLWLTSERGILRILKEELKTARRGQEFIRINPIFYGKKDGMLSEECTVWSLYSSIQTRAGRILVGTKKGLAIIDPDGLKINKNLPRVVIDQIYLNGQRFIKNGNRNNFRSLKKIVFHFTSPTFITPEKIRFRYRLEGYKDKWVDVEPGKPRTATFTDLAAGSYNFRVIACNSDGVWNKSGDLFTFSYQVPVYKNPVFKLVAALLLLAFVFSGYYFVFRKKAREKYKHSHLDQDKVTSVVKKLHYLMEVENIFKQEDISLNSLAEKLEVTPHFLSQILNEKLKKSFSDYINGYRVETAKIELQDPKNKNKTILYIAFLVGFNSKPAFNRAFKKYMKMTPSEFRKKNPPGAG